MIDPCYHPLRIHQGIVATNARNYIPRIIRLHKKNKIVTLLLWHTNTFRRGLFFCSIYLCSVRIFGAKFDFVYFTVHDLLFVDIKIITLKHRTLCVKRHICIMTTFQQGGLKILLTKQSITFYAKGSNQISVKCNLFVLFNYMTFI